MASRGIIDLRIITADKAPADVTAFLNSYAGKPAEALRAIVNRYGGYATGRGVVIRGRGVTFTNNVPTTQSITVTVGTNPANNDTLRFGNVLITWKTSGSGENQVTIGGNTTATATALKNAINAHSILAGLMTATSSTNVVTLTVTYPDIVHGLLYMASSTANVTVSGQFTTSGLSYTTSTATPIAGGTF